MIIERVKKFFEFQRRSVHGQFLFGGVLNGIFYFVSYSLFLCLWQGD